MSTSLQTGPGRLNGWKEIAAYLGKGSRTVQRWEKLYGLPVHRIGREGGEIVFAFRDEIDRWAARAGHSQTASDASRALNYEAGPGKVPARGREGPGLRKALGLLAVVAGLTIVTLVVVPPPWRTAAHPSDAPPRPPADWRLENEHLVVFDDAGRRLFEHAFDFGLTTSASSATRNDLARPPVLIADVEGDGRLEILVMPPSAARENARLYCFEADGRLRFVLGPTGQARFGDREYGGPWLAHRVFVTEGARGARSLWAVFIHNLWFPARLQELDPRGAVKQEYWSDGYIETVTEGVWQGRPVVLAGGVNNELKGASLAIFDRDAFGGKAPASNPKYACSSCPGGAPRELLVFPTLCIYGRKGGIAGLHEAWFEGEDRVMVQVTQATGSFDGPSSASRIPVSYTLGRDLAPVHAEIGPEFKAAHVLLERQGLLDHPFGPRDVAAMLPVRRWDGTRFVELPTVKVAH